MANLKTVIQHNSVELIESFKKDLVRYANALWKHDIVAESVKDNALDVNSANESLRASLLVTNLTRKFTALEDRDVSQQTDCMKVLLKSLESGGEMELVGKIRIELKKKFQIEIQPFYANPSSDSSGVDLDVPYYPQSEPIDMFHEQDGFLTEPVPIFEKNPVTHQQFQGMTVGLPFKKLSLQNDLQCPRQLVYSQNSSNSHVTRSYPAFSCDNHNPSQWEKMKTFRLQRHSTGTKVTTFAGLAHPSSISSHSAGLAHNPHSANDYDEKQSELPESSGQYEMKQMHPSDDTITRENGINELKERLQKADQEVAEQGRYVVELKQKIESLQSEIEAKRKDTQHDADIETLLAKQHEQIKTLHSNMKNDLVKKIANIEKKLTKHHKANLQQIEALHLDVKAKSDLAIAKIDMFFNEQHDAHCNRLQVLLKEETEAHDKTKGDYQQLANRISNQDEKVFKIKRMTCFYFAILITIFVVLIFK